MNWSLRNSVAVLAGAVLLTVAIAPEAEAQRRRGGRVAVGVIGAGVIGAAIGHAIAQGHRKPRAAKKRYNRKKAPAETARTEEAQDQGDERVSPPLITQYALYALGHYPGPLNGRPNNNLVLAVGKWQQQNQIEATGQLTPKQFEMVRGILVAIQQRLDRLGFDPGPSDGNVTRRLRESVQRFQTKLGVRADGYLTNGEYSKLVALDEARATKIAMDRVFDRIASSSGVASTPRQDAAESAADSAEPASFRSLCSNTAAAPAFTMTLAAAAGSQEKPEQFCLARSQAIEEGTAIFKSLAARAKTITADIVRAECARFAESKRQDIAALQAGEPGKMAVQLAKTMPANARQREIAVGNAKVCLGFGYADDKPEVALGSTLFLLGLGETGYAEIVAGHLAWGVGAPKDAPKAVAWLEFTAAELDGGKHAIKGDPAGRAKVLRDIAATLQKRAESAKADDAGPGIGPQFSLAAHEPESRSVVAKTSSGANLPPYVPLLQDNVVYIFSGESSGTGFFVAPNLIVTNDHVVGSSTRVLIASKSLPLNVQRAKVLYRGMTGGFSDRLGIDAAVIEVEGYQHPTFLKFVKDPPPVTSFVAVGGFPGRSMGKDRGIEDFFKVIAMGNLPTAEQLPHLTISSGNVQSYFPDKQSGRERMQHSAQTSKGSSGSPIVNACGEVVALLDSGSTQTLKDVVRRGYVEGTDFIWTYTSREVLKFLKSVKVDIQTTSEPCRVATAGATVQ